MGSLEGQWNVVRKYDVDADNLREGKNIILVRVEDTGGGGGLYGDAADLVLYFHQLGNMTFQGNGDSRLKKSDLFREAPFNPIKPLLYFTTK